MGYSESGDAPASRNPDRIPTSAVFGEPPGIDGVMFVGAEHGDVVIHAELARFAADRPARRGQVDAWPRAFPACFPCLTRPRSWKSAWSGA